MINRQCSLCKIVKPITDFSKAKGNNGKDGYNYKCKKCNNKLAAKYYLKNKEHCNTKNKQYYQENKEKYKINYKNFKKNNPNWEKEYIKQRRNDPIKGPLIKVYYNILDGIKRGMKIINHQKDQSTLEVVGLGNWSLFREHIEKQFTEGMNWGNYGNKRGCWSIDHIIPISSATTKEEVYKLNHYTNLRPMWHIENIKKGKK